MAWGGTIDLSIFGIGPARMQFRSIPREKFGQNAFLFNRSVFYVIIQHSQNTESQIEEFYALPR